MVASRRSLPLVPLFLIVMTCPVLAADLFVGVSFVQSFEESAKNGFGIQGGVLFEISDIVQIGPEIGWSNFGKSVTDVNVQGTGYDRYQEIYDTDLWHILAVARIGKQGDGLRPFAQGGLGAYIVRAQDEIRYYNQGQEVPELYFEQSASDTEAGVNAGGGVRLDFGSSFESVLEGRLDLPFAFSPEDGFDTHAIGRILGSFAYRF